jgi:hypothetical protein
MSRAHKRPVPMITTSPAKLAAALNNTSTNTVRQWIDDGLPPVYEHGNKRHVIIADALSLVRSWPQTKPRNRKPAT